MRVYLPGTLTLLRQLDAAGELPPPLTGFAVTPAVREWYASGDAEELEYAAFSEAARASLRLIDADPAAPRRRVVIAIDAADADVQSLADLDRAAVRVTAPVRVGQVASIHVDGPEAEGDVAAAAAAMLEAELGSDDAQFTVDAAEGHELEWHATQELRPLLDLFAR